MAKTRDFNLDISLRAPRLASSTAKAPAAEARGYDAGKKIKGRKRHIAVDADGRLLMVNLTTADVSDSAGGQHILDAIPQALAVCQASVRRRCL
jgi:hypothetical protein